MKQNHNISLIFFLVINFIATSCHPTHHLTKYSSSPKHGSDPKFLDNVTLPINKNKVKLSTTTPHKEYKGKGKTPEKINEVLVNKEVMKPFALKEKYATMMNVSEKEITNIPLYNFIDEWYGVPYAMGGTEKTGIDCSGFAGKLYSQIYGKELVHSSSEQYNEYRFTKKIKNLKEGDLVFFRNRGRKVSHVGVYLTNNFFVHASTTSGVMISNLDDDHWHHLYVGAGKVQKEK
ncbi:MAG: NlpC/P60 family protein [Bacteroidota bacterium]